MNKSFFIVIMSFISCFAFTDESATKNSLFESNYAKLGVSAIPTGMNYSVAPTVTYGKRGIIEGHGIDISTSLSGVQVDSHHYAIHCAAPKIIYLHFLEPKQGNKLYVGAGSSFSGTYFQDNQFLGLTANGLVGYAIESTALSAFVQFDASKPLIPVLRKTSLINEPTYEISFGLGF